VFIRVEELVFMGKQSRQELRELWAERIDAFLASGLSQRAWCRENGFNHGRLSYWLRKFIAEARQPRNGSWVSLDTIAPRSSGVLFRIGSVTLEVQRGFDAQVLADVIRSLMEVC